MPDEIFPTILNTTAATKHGNTTEVITEPIAVERIAISGEYTPAAVDDPRAVISAKRRGNTACMREFIPDIVSFTCTITDVICTDKITIIAA